MSSVNTCASAHAHSELYNLSDTAMREDGIAELERRLEQLRSKLCLAVVFGGNKSVAGSVIYESNNARSWKSYEAVANNIADSLREIGFRNVSLMPDDMHLGDRLRRSDIHLAWLNSGGVQGYNSAAHAAATLEMLGVPFIGHDSLAATTPWMKFFLEYEPSTIAPQVKTPVLILQGETDHQVPLSEAEKLATAFRAGANPSVTVHTFPATNHLFVADPTGGFDYGKLPSLRVRPEVLGAIADWLDTQFR